MLVNWGLKAKVMSTPVTLDYAAVGGRGCGLHFAGPKKKVLK